MTRFTFAISPDANPSMIRNILENIKGVLANSISITQTDPKDIPAEGSKTLSHEEYMEKLHSLINSIDKTAIDRTDDKTQYILSK